MGQRSFETTFEKLTGFQPLGWQCRLYEMFAAGDFSNCATCSLPTGLGKTSLLTLWLMALAKNPDAVPRRLAYVVNRRTVVDQTTFEAEKLRSRLSSVPEIESSLRDMCSVIGEEDESLCPLAISTLRGQFADNQQWASDPCRPAIISGTVDMIGSRLLFDGYRCGFKSKPLHAGFLGTDTLLIHDEAHLEPAFQSLCESIEEEQKRGRFPEDESSRRFRVIALSATNRDRASNEDGALITEPFELLPREYKEPVVKKRVFARKGIKFHEVEKETHIGDAIVELAERHSETGQAIIIFVRTITDLTKVMGKLSTGRKNKVTQLAGPMRGHERERLVTKDAVFQRFLPESSRNVKVNPEEGTVYLVSTSAGEVGVNISADHMVSDLTAFESIAQRLGRVNRFGEGNATVDLVAPESIVKESDEKLKPFQRSMMRTWNILKKLPKQRDGRYDGSSSALAALPSDAVAQAFSPSPEILPVDEYLFDAWSLTTLSMASEKGDVPGRPPIEEWLHGVSENDPPQTQVAWRREVQQLTEDVLANQARPVELTQVLQAYPLKPIELLQDRTSRIFDGLKSMVESFDAKFGDAKADGSIGVWLVDRKGSVTSENLRNLIDPSAKANDRKRLEAALAFKTIVLPSNLGGLDQNGMLSGKVDKKHDADVADELFSETKAQLRMRFRTDQVSEATSQTRTLMREVLRIRLGTSDANENEPVEMVWCVRRRDLDDESLSFSGTRKQLLGPHLASAEIYARRFTEKLRLKKTEADAIIVAAKYHDLGKRRELWQRGLGNLGYVPGELGSSWAKSGTFRPPVNRHYRHEFGSLSDVQEMSDFQSLSEGSKDLALHLIAAHHGRARPHFPADEAFDPERNQQTTDDLAAHCPIRFGRLQRKYGRWQLAWLESLVRAADYLASQKLIDDADLSLPLSMEATA